MVKWIIGVIVIAGAGFYLVQSGLLGTTPKPQAAVQQQQPVAAPAPQAQKVSSGLPTADNDASDQAIVKDSAAVDAQMAGLGSDSTSVDQSLNDKPVSQSY